MTMWPRVRYGMVLVGLCALATFPTAQRSCTAKNRAREATNLLTVLADRIEDHVRSTGRMPPRAAPRTPIVPCCLRGGTCTSDATMWNANAWRDLEFWIEGKFRYTYEYRPDPSGRSAIVQASGDLNCDGKTSLYELKLRISGNAVERTWSRRDPYE